MSEAIIASVRQGVTAELQSSIVRREQELTAKQKAVCEQHSALKQREVQIEQQIAAEVQKRLNEEIAAARASAVKNALETQELTVKQLQQQVDEQASKLKAANAQELALRLEKRQLEEAKEALQLEVQRQLDEERGKLKTQLKAQSDEENRFKIAEKEKLISDLRDKLEDAQRKAEQGSQQIQGEVLEVDFEQRLRKAFPVDQITEVSKGVRGADVRHEVIGKAGRPCGFILYENKRTKNWSDGWVAKLKEDMLKAGAEIGVIVTEAMPPETESFCQRDAVWVTDVKSAIPLAHVLRCILQEVSLAKGYRQGAKEKMELLYSYLTGTEFRQRVSAVIDAFQAMRSDLERERRSLTKAWSKREKQINAVVENMAGMIGDVQGISGNALQEIPALELEDESLEIEEEELADANA